jgi:hypothetical protein
MEVGIISFTPRPPKSGGKSRQFDTYIPGPSVVKLVAHEDTLSNFRSVISLNTELKYEYNPLSSLCRSMWLILSQEPEKSSRIYIQ